MVITVLLIFSILAGQLIKFPLFYNLGPTSLDFFILFFNIFGLLKIKFKLQKPNPPILLGFLFIVIAIISLIFTPLHLQFIEYLFSFSYTARLFLYLLFSWTVYSGAFPTLRKNIFLVFSFSGTGIAILGLLQLLFFPNLETLQISGWDPHYLRTVSTFLDPNFTGAYLVLTLLLLSQNIFKTKKTAIFFFLVTYIALLTTFSRSSYLMFLTSGISLSFLKKSKTIFLSTIILFVLLLLGFQSYSHLIAKPRGINREQSASFRLDTWQQGLTLFQKSPILGIGFNSYKYGLAEYHLADSQFLQSRGSSTNDSSLIYVLSTTGVVGIFIYSLFLISLLKLGIKNNPILTAAIIGLLPHSLFANSLFYPFILIWLLLKAVDTKNQVF